MAFFSKQAATAGTGIKTTVVANEHIQNITLVDQSGNPIPILGIEPESLNEYVASDLILPTTLTTNLDYFIFRNPSETKRIKIKSIKVNQTFSGTAAATRSNFVLQKVQNVTATTGNLVTITKKNNASINSIIEVKGLPTGLAATGFTNAGVLAHLSLQNQVNASNVDTFTFSNPILLLQNEAIVVRSNGAIVAGAGVAIFVEFYEV